MQKTHFCIFVSPFSFLLLTGAILSPTRMEKCLNQLSRLEVGRTANLILTMSSLPWWPSSLFQHLKAGQSEYIRLIHKTIFIWWTQKEPWECISMNKLYRLSSTPFFKSSTRDYDFHFWHLMKHSQDRFNMPKPGNFLMPCSDIAFLCMLLAAQEVSWMTAGIILLSWDASVLVVWNWWHRLYSSRYSYTRCCQPCDLQSLVWTEALLRSVYPIPAARGSWKCP